MNALPYALALVSLWGATDGPPAIVAVTGSGGLTAGVDRDGVLSVLRWPDPGGPDQMASPVSGKLTGGGRWGVRAGNRTFWIGDADARVTDGPATDAGGTVRASVEWEGTNVRADIRLAVSTDSAVLLTNIEMYGLDTAPVALWRSEWAPRTHLVPELPYADGPFDPLNGFAAVPDAARGRVWHLRPDKPGQADWSQARALAAAGVPIDEWADAFSDGIWIGLASTGTPSTIGGVPARVGIGPAASILEPTVENRNDTYHATVAIAVGATYTEADALLQAAAESVDPFLHDATSAVAPFPGIGQIDPTRRELAERNWQVLQRLRDPATGRVVRGAGVAPPMARDWPRYGAWIATALGAAGDRAAAGTILSHYLDAIRTNDAPGQPYGSMPESFYTNGEIASPRFIVDDRAPARTLFALWRHTEPMPDAERDAFLKRHQTAIRAAGEFLSVWVDSRRGAPLWSADPIGFADADTQSRTFDQFAGLVAAKRLVQAAGGPVPDAWEQRADTLRDLCTWIVNTPSVGWSPAHAMVTEFDGLDPDTIRTIQNATRSALEGLGAYSADEAAHLACQAALLPEPTEPTIERIPANRFWQAIEQASQSGTEVDTYRASLVLFAISRFSGR